MSPCIRPSGRLGRRAGRLLWPLLLLLPLGGIESFAALFAPSADLWPRWQAHDPQSSETIDHGALSELVARFSRLDGEGVRRVDYAGLARDGRAELDAYIARLSATPIDGFDRPEQFAFWVNLYNALTLRVVADHWPVESIRDIDISPGWFSDGPWDRELVEVEGEALSLNDIEHRILRPIWGDARVHYVVNCAAVGCPNLSAKALTGAGHDRRLDAAARAYVNDPRGVGFVDGRLVVSSIYVWFQEDFGDEAALLAHLRRYAAPELAERLAKAQDIHDHAYDWTVNALESGSAAD